MKYNLIATDDTQNITVVHDGEMYVANGEHPNWALIVAAAVANDENIVNLFDQTKQIAEKFSKLSERVSVANGRVYFDNDETDNAVTDHILRIVSEGAGDLKPVVAFLEKVMTNVNEHSIEQLYRWLTNRKFTLSEDGDIVAYKGVQLIDGVPHSISSGTAIVDGELKRGQIPNAVGSVVEMPRSEVQFDPGVGCSTGLHAGTYEYARDFGRGQLLQIHINPRDVVSVPTDCADAKMRVCRYTVVDTITEEITDAVWSRDSDYYGDVDDDEDDDYDDFDDEDDDDEEEEDSGPVFPGLSNYNYYGY